MEVAQAVLQSALDTDRLYKENMALQHGLERPHRIDLATPPVMPSIPTPRPASDAAAGEGGLRLAPYLISAAIALGSGGLGSALTAWLASRSPPATTAAPPAAVESPIGTDSLLSDLQERGFHLPPANGGSSP